MAPRYGKLVGALAWGPLHATNPACPTLLQEWNELHHLLIMEALGGDARWRDRFLAFHAAILYYWAL
eukprot:267445-Chlamydomonas_euryale.AAC.1